MDTKYFLGRNVPKLSYFEGKKRVLSCHIGYSNLAHSSHSSCGSGVHLIHKIEKKKEKTMLLTPLNIATQYVVVEPLYRSK
jgi:hypothetical protein